MQSIELDRVAIWLPQPEEGILSRAMPIGTRYITKDSTVFKQTTQPMWRFVKNYEVGKGKSKVKFCLFVRTFEDEMKSVEAELDRVAKKLTREAVEKLLAGANFVSFSYTDEYIKQKEGR